MEQKKTLWIIAAVGVFLLVVLGGALLVFNTSKKSTSAFTTNMPVEKKGFDAWSSMPEPPAAPNNGFVSTKAQDMVVLSENTKVYGFNPEPAAPAQIQSPEYQEAPVTTPAANQTQTIDLNALKRETQVAAAQPVNPNINITVNIPDTSAKAADNYVTVQSPVSVSSEYYIQEVESKSVTKVNNKATSVERQDPPKPVAPAPSVTPKVEAKPAAPAASSKAPAVTVTTPKVTATTTTAAPKPVTRYWVQVAAYSNKNTAENARSTLTEKKINSDIYTYQDAKDKLYYRVRVGPFTTKSEAEYWKAKIVEIKDFTKAGSYVTSTTD